MQLVFRSSPKLDEWDKDNPDWPFALFFVSCDQVLAIALALRSSENSTFLSREIRPRSNLLLSSKGFYLQYSILTIKRKPIKRKERYKRILIVDDDEIVVHLIKEILEREGFKTEVARDGIEGLEKIKQNEYDVIISNREMPRMRGEQLYLEVQKLSQKLAKRIIFISGDITDFIRSTGNRFLAKPFSHQQLIEVVKNLIVSDM